MPPPPVHLEKVLRHAERKLVNEENLKPTDLLDLYRRFLKLEEHRLKLAHGSGEGGRSFAQKRADLMSVVLRHVWEGAWQSGTRGYKGKLPRVSLMAVGGFGRGELNPGSDIDIHFLHDAKGREDAAFVKEVVEQVLYMLWDVGFHVGHATRTSTEEVENANSDLRTKTSLLESHLLIGDGSLYEEFGRTFERMCIKGKEQEFLNWRLADQAERHAKYGNTVFLQEPHVKNGCGGLRDYQNMLWMAQVKRNIATSGGLVEAQLLTVTERKQLDAAYDFLLRLRTELHYLQKRNGDILTLQLQGRIANSFKYKQHTILRRTEALMRNYYQHTNTIFQLTNNLARRFAGTQAKSHRVRWSFLPFRAAKPELIDGFILQNGTLEASEPGIFTADPFRILRVFVIAQQRHAEIGPELSARIRRRLSLIDRSFIYHKKTREMILKLFSKKGEVGAICRLMHEHGVLGRLFPEFRPLTCLVQHEFFHRYTADEHTIVCLEMLDKILGAKEPPFSKYEPLMVSVERPDLLYLAMLLHDTGKSSNSRHHSEDSAVNAVRVSRRMHLDAKELATLVFLVDHHMTMSETARSRNLDDEETIFEFARVVQTKERLDMLMLLTFADYQGTDSRQLWSDWKELLLWQLYNRTARALEGGHEFKLAEQKSLEELKTRIKAKLGDEIDSGEVDAHFKNLPARYFNNLPESLIATHIQYVHEFFFSQVMHDDAALKPTIHWLHQPDQGHSVVTVVTWDRERCFAKITGAFAASGLSILSADINTRDDSIVIDTFRVSTDRQEAVTDVRDRKSFEENLARSFSQAGYEFPNLEEAGGKRMAGYEDAEFPTRIYFDHQSSRDYTLLDLQTPDQPGLLYRVACCLADNEIDIGFARITTEKGAALDTFYITDQKGEKVTDEDTLRRITQAVTKSATRP
ncbi:MAG: [protein-PII] uridylyltransferase [Verrucomicrobia bacterium Tous-C9LFEB]|nr:MAG: [protein-PII] uridylyltransferase [Verrucomicrobia bacterium Tous-C9LFEB]